MKKILIILFCLMAIPIFGTAVNRLYTSDGENVVVPIEKQEEGEESANPRIFNNSPIVCLYSNFNLTFFFYEYFEDITIRVENITTDEQWTLTSSSSSCVSIPVSSAGVYYISIYTDSGYYSGSFTKSN